MKELRLRTLGVVVAIALALAGCGSGAPSQRASEESARTQQTTMSVTTTSQVPVPSTTASTMGHPCSDPKVAETTCSNKEVTQTNCDGSQGGEKPITVKSEVVTLAGVTGTLTIRMANPAQCAHIMWPRFEPDAATSRGDFVVTAQVGTLKADQPSQPGNDKLSAWTEGLFVPPGREIRGCMAVGGRHQCIVAQSV